VDVVPLGEPAGSTHGLIPSVFWTLGIASFNTAGEAATDNEVDFIHYGAFAIFVFVLVPMVFLNLVWLLLCALRVWFRLESRKILNWRNSFLLTLGSRLRAK
jgi:hypothetical protein